MPGGEPRRERRRWAMAWMGSKSGWDEGGVAASAWWIGGVCCAVVSGMVGSTPMVMIASGAVSGSETSIGVASPDAPLCEDMVLVFDSFDYIVLVLMRCVFTVDEVLVSVTGQLPFWRCVETVVGDKNEEGRLTSLWYGMVCYGTIWYCTIPRSFRIVSNQSAMWAKYHTKFLVLVSTCCVNSFFCLYTYHSVLPVKIHG